MYFKNDDKLYTLNNNGDEVEIGSGGGGGANLIIGSIVSAAGLISNTSYLYCDGSTFN